MKDETLQRKNAVNRWLEGEHKLKKYENRV